MPIFRLQKNQLIIAQKTNVEFESHLEIWLENSPMSLVQDELVLWIDRQPSARDDEGPIFPDLLGVDLEGNLVIVELKRGKTPREVIAQLLDYAAWANELSQEDIHTTAEDYFLRVGRFEGRTFADAFRESFEIPETDDLPPFNRKLRLFVVAEEIQPRVARVCRFLRTSYGMDVSCVAVSMFRTESGEEIVSLETKVGDEEMLDAGRRRPASRWSGDKAARDVVLEAVQGFTRQDANVEFTLQQIYEHLRKKYPDFNRATLSGQITAGCPNHDSYHHHQGNYKYYWKIGRGKYRLYDCHRDEGPPVPDA